jgi:hypothetical protein
MLVTSYRRRSNKFSFFKTSVYYIEVRRYNNLKEFNTWLQQRFPDKQINIMKPYKKITTKRDEKLHAQ